ncbi:MAG: rhodanese-like domain-containing protein [Chitinispirillaceae bacterium]|nr:rhodanese-like domain-containing protein [Chitinispirillaceae bacterium]
MGSLFLLLVFFTIVLLLSIVRARQARKEIEAALRSGALVVDLRSPKEFAHGHFSTAVNIPHDKVGQVLESQGIRKNRLILLYSTFGPRSAVTEQLLRRNGYTSIINARSLANLKRFDTPRDA